MSEQQPQQSTIASFEARLKELVSFANRNKGVIEVDKVNDFFKERYLNVRQIDKIYEYLEAHNIVVLNPSEDDEPDDDILMDMDDEAEYLADVDDLSLIANTMSDDPVKQYLKEIGGYPLLSVAEEIELAADHIAFTAVTKEERVSVRVNIPGGFMVYNTLDVLGAALALGISLERSAEALAKVPAVKGRVEVVPTPGKDYTVLIDYAHSPDGLENVLSSVKGFAKGRTIALFGCGGDRDRTKRPKMGAIAAKIADFVVVTTDNPRTEQPADIIADILPGMEDSKTPYVVVVDRVEAIHWAMDHAQAGDVIVLCGKGHETYQEINHVKYHMDEREIVAEYLLR